MKALYVHHEAKAVGELVEAEDGLRFRYSADWVADGEGFALCMTLPRQPGWFLPAVVRPFFDNLLPDGALRIRLAQLHGVSESHTFALLAIAGEECAGALRITAEAGARPAGGYRALTDAELIELAQPDADVLALAEGLAGELRLSLAGAQSKLALFVDAEGALHLPRGSAASTHIAKFDSTRFKHVTANEVWTTTLGQRVGLQTQNLTLRQAGRHHLSLATRYDRQPGEEGVVRRIHQQDICQALGRLPSQKYEGEGGPSLAECLAVLRAHSLEPLTDTAEFLRRTLFNLAVGNADAHGKNTALYRPTTRGWRLAPAYDLVCTAAFRHLSRGLAMHFASGLDLEQVNHHHLSHWARSVGLGPGYVRREARQICTAILDQLRAHSAAFRERHGPSPAVERCERAARKQARGLMARLA
ncbi:MAG: type II toxin-antitoxin system HipA family toxin [Polyangiales bacterium]